MWHEGLEEASRLYFGERNVKGMFAVLEPLHAMMERGPQTLKETSFNQVSVNSDPLTIYICPQVVAAVFRGGLCETYTHSCGCTHVFIALGEHFAVNCSKTLLLTTGLRPGFNGSTGLVQEVHAIWKCKGLDAGLGPLLSRIQTHLKTTPSGGQNQSCCSLRLNQHEFRHFRQRKNPTQLP